jgi:hypothetical protein
MCRCHKVILASGSKYFLEVFCKEDVTKITKVIQLVVIDYLMFSLTFQSPSQSMEIKQTMPLARSSSTSTTTK